MGFHSNGNSFDWQLAGHSPKNKNREMSAATVKHYCVLFCDFRDGHVEKQEKQQKNEKMKPKVRRHHTSKSDEPDLQESAFLKKIIAYQRKLLVLGDFLSFCLNSLYMFQSNCKHVNTV